MWMLGSRSSTSPGRIVCREKWTGPTQLIVLEHQADGSSVFIRPFLEGDEDEQGDREEDMREVPTQKTRGGKQYTKLLVFDKCPTSLLPVSLPVAEPENITQNVATFEFARRKGDSLSRTMLRQHCPEDMQGFHREISSPALARSPSGGPSDRIAQQFSKLTQAIETLTIVRTKTFAVQQAMETRLRALERSPSPTAAEHPSAGGTGAGPRRKGVLGPVQPDGLSDPDDWAELRDRRASSEKVFPVARPAASFRALRLYSSASAPTDRAAHVGRRGGDVGVRPQR